MSARQSTICRNPDFRSFSNERTDSAAADYGLLSDPRLLLRPMVCDGADMSPSSNSHRSKYAKRGPVTMPVEPPYSALRAIACNPIILAASDEHSARIIYDLLRKALAERKK